jgi:maltooligosyltrehalose trehalohydrolase
VGNRAAGDRIAASLPLDLLKVGAGLVLTAPCTPMLFMGEEWAARTPWQYFTDHQDPRLGRKVAEGRRAEFAAHGWQGDVPDPQDEAVFLRSKLDWTELDGARQRGLLAWYRELIALRKNWPELTDPRLDRVRAEFDEAGRWLVVSRGRLRVAVNLAATAQRLPLCARGGTALGADCGTPLGADCGTPLGADCGASLGANCGTVLAASSPGVAADRDFVLLPPCSLAVLLAEGGNAGPRPV